MLCFLSFSRERIASVTEKGARSFISGGSLINLLIHAVTSGPISPCRARSMLPDIRREFPDRPCNRDQTVDDLRPHVLQGQFVLHYRERPDHLFCLARKECCIEGELFCLAVYVELPFLRMMKRSPEVRQRRQRSHLLQTAHP